MKEFIKPILLFVLFCAFTEKAAATKYEVLHEESILKWTGEKVTGRHFGTIDIGEGWLEINENLIGGSIQVNMQTIKCDDLQNENWNNRLVEHLKADDFFGVEQHPVSVLTLKEWKQVEADQYQITADLTIKGITNSLVFNTQMVIKDGFVRALGSIKVDRTIYEINYRSGKIFNNLGNNMIDDFFTLDFMLVAKVFPETALKIN